jgi:hypothetical protein
VAGERGDPADLSAVNSSRQPGPRSRTGDGVAFAVEDACRYLRRM